MMAVSRTARPLPARCPNPERALVESSYAIVQAALHQVQLALETGSLSLRRFWSLQLDSNHSVPTVTAVAHHLAVTNPSVSAVVDGLVRTGLVRRRRSNRDRRVLVLLLTPEGRRVEVRAWRAIVRVPGNVTETLSPEKLEVTVGALEAVASWLCDHDVTYGRVGPS
jgi:DNA-binding MarR family transcriptional regulator